MPLPYPLPELMEDGHLEAGRLFIAQIQYPWHFWRI